MDICHTDLAFFVATGLDPVVHEAYAENGASVWITGSKPGNDAGCKVSAIKLIGPGA